MTNRNNKLEIFPVPQKITYGPGRIKLPEDISIKFNGLENNLQLGKNEDELKAQYGQDKGLRKQQLMAIHWVVK